MTRIDRAALEEIVRARDAIECAIITLKFYSGSLTEGQIKEIKRVLYGLSD